MTTEYSTAPLSADRWSDLEAVFGPSGGYCGCWCMYWREPRRHFEDRDERAKMKARFRARVEAGPPPGLIAYADGEPVGWLQVGPRADVPNWNGARRLSAPTSGVDPDDPGVWAMSCFVVKKGWRKKGVSRALVSAAIDWARTNGARLLDACPVEPAAKKPPVSLYHGLASTFRRAGFEEVARRRDDRPLMRLEIAS